MHAQTYYYLTRFVLKHFRSLKTCSCSPNVYNWFKCAKIAHPNVKISIYAFSQCFFLHQLFEECVTMFLIINKHKFSSRSHLNLRKIIQRTKLRTVEI